MLGLPQTAARMPVAIPDSERRRESRQRGFAALAGFFLGLGLLKFGNPAVVDRLVTPPRGYWEFLLMPWPLAWGYALWALVLVFGLFVAERRLPRPRGLALLPAAWLAWQGLAALGTSDARLTGLHLPYFLTLVGGFYLGMLALAPVGSLRVFWLALTGCFAAVLVVGFQQHFGGLEAVRQHVLAQPGAEQLPADYLRRLEAQRIFATLVYPNALAGAILLLLPPLVVAGWELGAGGPSRVRRVLPVALAGGGLACLYWTKSKAGWLLALGLVLVLGLRLRLPARWKWILAGLVLAAGLTAFAVRFAGYFQGGAASAGARLEYWRAAWTTACRYPVLGSGPGTFASSYRPLKPPGAEMTLLAHNDYLQQASDSGFPGALLYLGFWAGSLGLLARRVWAEPLPFAVWLGLLGWALQGWVEFALYVPGVAWTAFWLLGWLWGRAARSESGEAAPLPGRAAGTGGGLGPAGKRTSQPGAVGLT